PTLPTTTTSRPTVPATRRRRPPPAFRSRPPDVHGARTAQTPAGAARGPHHRLPELACTARETHRPGPTADAWAAPSRPARPRPRAGKACRWRVARYRHGRTHQLRHARRRR